MVRWYPPDLNTDILRRAISQQNIVWWLESIGLDGLREDTFPTSHANSGRDCTPTLRRIYPRLATSAKFFHPIQRSLSFFAGGKRGWDNIDHCLTTVFRFPAFFAIRDVLLRNAPAGQIANVLRQDRSTLTQTFLVPSSPIRYPSLATLTAPSDKPNSLSAWF